MCPSLRHLRRFSAPRFWPISPKEYVWTVKPSPGPHPKDRCFPLLIILRDILHYAKTAREARRILAEGKVKVDGVVRRNYKFPVGLMDVIEIVPTGEFFRVVPHPVKVLTLHPISKEEAQYKLVRIENKTTVKGGHIQLNLHDGRNILIRVKDPMNPVEARPYTTLDTLLIKVPSQEIVKHIKLRPGVYAIVVWGENVGRVGRIISIEQFFKRRQAIVTLRSPSGEEFRTILDYVFPIGEDKPVISLPEECFK